MGEFAVTTRTFLALWTCALRFHRPVPHIRMSLAWPAVYCRCRLGPTTVAAGSGRLPRCSRRKKSSLSKGTEPMRRICILLAGIVTLAGTLLLSAQAQDGKAPSPLPLSLGERGRGEGAPAAKSG